MLTQEQQFKKQIADAIASFEFAFPNVSPPEPRWFHIWLTRYPFWSLKNVIQTLSTHSLKDQFTTESTGRAISALLRADALKRALDGSGASHDRAKSAH